MTTSNAEGPHQCHGRDCTSRTLIKAHIMPAGFARAMHGEGGHNLGLSIKGAGRAQYQLGAFDKSILCDRCDKKLGLLDEFALALCMQYPGAPKPGVISKVPDVACRKLVAFATSVVWRASISTLETFAEIDLGALSSRARDIAFGDTITAFPVIANRLVSNRYDVREFYVQPIRRRLAGLNAYTFHLGGFQWFVVADSRPVTGKLKHLVINNADELVSLAVPLENTTEFQGMLAIADCAGRRV